MGILEKVISSRDVKAVLIKGFYEQTMLSLHKIKMKRICKHVSSSKGIMVAALEKTHLLSSYKYQASEKKNNNILCHFPEKKGLIIKFYKSLSQ